jgi:predicted ATPase/DNA-binding winged helix-turn-helix (wHTH) protein
MQSAREILFRPFRLDIDNEILWRGARVIALRQKSFALLRYLAERPGQLVAKEEILRAIWPETRVSDIVLKVCIREVRQVLGDQSQSPSFIETVQRRGYRFIRPVRRQEWLGPPQAKKVKSAPRAVRQQRDESPPRQAFTLPVSSSFGYPSSHPSSAPLVGREEELTQLHAWLTKAQAGERQVVFISGESGIGKTTLVEAFLAQAATTGVRIAHGQCAAHYGVGEAYLPVIEVVQRLCREPGNEGLLEVLDRQAPLWLAQMPSLLTSHDRTRLQREVRGATRERMLREIAAALEAFTADAPLVLVLDDLHWSDHATVDLFSFVGWRPEPARLLLLGAYRPEDIGAGANPLKSVRHELQAHGRCHHLSLSPFTVSEVDRYLSLRFTANHFPSPLAQAIHQRSEGNPLFVVNVVDHLVAHGVLAPHDGSWSLAANLDDIQFEEPATVQEFIEHQRDRLSPQEEQVLKVASVAGLEFSTAAVAAGLPATLEDVEDWCEGLTRHQQCLRSRGSGEWPDGAIVTYYEFAHSLYQHGWYERVTAARRVQLHQRIAARLEQGYGNRAGEIAAELAEHCERGRDFPRALHYRRVAAENAARRFGYQEAVKHLAKGLESLTHVSDTQERLRHEIALHNALGAVYMATQGYASPAVAQAYERARMLCRQVDATAQLTPALRGLWSFYLTRMELHTARTLADQLLHIARREQSQALLLEAERELGQTLYCLGEFPAARQALEDSLARYDPDAHATHITLYGQDPKVACLAQLARTLCLLGSPDQALHHVETALAFAREIAHPYTLALAFYHAAVVFQACGDWQRTVEAAQSAMTLSTEHGFPYWLSASQILYGWALSRQSRVEEGIRYMQQGIAAYAETGATLNRPYALALLAEAYGATGRPDEGLVLLNEALALIQDSGGHFYQAEILRLRGELLVQQAAIA